MVLCYVTHSHNIIHILGTQSNTIAVYVLVFAMPKHSGEIEKIQEMNGGFDL